MTSRFIRLFSTTSSNDTAQSDTNDELSLNASDRHFQLKFNNLPTSSSNESTSYQRPRCMSLPTKRSPALITKPSQTLNNGASSHCIGDSKFRSDGWPDFEKLALERRAATQRTQSFNSPTKNQQGYRNAAAMSRSHVPSPLKQRSVLNLAAYPTPGQSPTPPF